MRQIRIITICLLAMTVMNSVYCQEKKDQQFNNPNRFSAGFGAGFNWFELSYYNNDAEQSLYLLRHQCESFQIYSTYSVFNRLAVGGYFHSAGFISSNRSEDKKVFSSIGLLASYKFIELYRDNLSFEISPLYSWIKYTYDIGIAPAQDPTGSFSEYIVQIKRQGFGMCAAVRFEHYFSDRFGIFIRPEYNRYVYYRPEYPSLPNGYNFFPHPAKIDMDNYCMAVGAIFRF
jgi:hypothetical protein